MADRIRNTEYIMHLAECAMSPVILVARRDALMRDCGPNYHNEAGRKNDIAKFAQHSETPARRLVWC